MPSPVHCPLIGVAKLPAKILSTSACACPPTPLPIGDVTKNPPKPVLPGRVTHGVKSGLAGLRREVGEKIHQEIGRIRRVSIDRAIRRRHNRHVRGDCAVVGVQC